MPESRSSSARYAAFRLRFRALLADGVILSVAFLALALPPAFGSTTVQSWNNR